MDSVYSATAVAKRYDSARSLPPETMLLWMDALRTHIPKKSVSTILDLGCGTGRFTRALAQTFGCKAIGVEPSFAMLEVAESRGDAAVQWKHGSAEDIDLEDQSVDLVFMSQVFHHLPNPRRALAEIDRVLSPSGYLVLRNGTREHNAELEWLRFFPEAYQIEEERTPSAAEIATESTREYFVSVSHQTVRQTFASSYQNYLEKISSRGLSALVAISDDAFEKGLERFSRWVQGQPSNSVVYEPVDLFIFKKKGAPQ